MTATRASIKGNFGLRLPGRTRIGSQAYFRKGATIDARAGMAEILKRYNELVDSLHISTPEILRRALEPAFNKSIEYAPKRTGALVGSGVLDVTTTRDRAEAHITYGNAEAWYAALVHEYVWLNHKSPTRAKYLQAALEEELDSFIVSAAVDYALLLGD